MKRIIMVLVIVLAGCSKSPEEKAQKLIKEYIINNANDPKSYEPIEFSNLDTFFKDEYDIKGLDSVNKLMKEERISFEEFITLSDSVSKIKYKIPRDLKMNHSFRANNAFGAKIKSTKEFHFNFNVDSLLYIEDFN